MAKLDAALSARNAEALQRVNPLFDEINQSWARIESHFQKQGILREVEHRVDTETVWTGNDYEPVGEISIGVQKRRGKWRICYGFMPFHGPGEVEWTPITDCQIQTRIEFLEHVSKLFEKLVESNESYVPEVEKAVARSKEVLAELGIKVASRDSKKTR